MKLFTLGLLTICSIFSCTSEPKNLDEFMVDVSEFTINDSILKDGDYVEIIGSSGNLTLEHKIDFYNLVVVRSERTGDTVNVLVTTFFESDLNKPRTRFMSNTSVVGKLFEHSLNSEEMDELEKLNVNTMKPKSYKKVFYDSEFIQIDVREYPAIPGTLGDFIIEGNSDDFDL